LTQLRIEQHEVELGKSLGVSDHLDLAADVTTQERAPA
jgi:hypothetical protein